MKNKLFELRNVQVKYKNPQGEDFFALKDINLKVYEGDYLAILGTSGSGKTTLSNIIGTLNSSFTGEYEFYETKVHTLSDRKRVKLREESFGFIFQDYVLLDHLTALENVALSLHYSDISLKEIRALAIEKLNSVGLGDKINHKPFQLSGGQKQRVSIARALVKDPKVIIADEPTGALDHNSRVEILSLLQELNQQGVTIITVTHSEEDAQASGRIVRVEHGEIVSDTIQRDRSRFFGKMLNTEDRSKLEHRNNSVLEYLNLKFGINSKDDFISFSKNNLSLESKYLLLSEFSSEWMCDKILGIMNSWWDEDEVIRLLIIKNILNSTQELSPTQLDFFSSPWEEESSMFFLKNFHSYPVQKIKDVLNVSFFVQHTSKKVRASSIEFFKAQGFFTQSEFLFFLPSQIRDTDGRVRSNIIDLISTKEDVTVEYISAFNLDDDPYHRVRAAWANLLIMRGFTSRGHSILEPMLFSNNQDLILASCWVYIQDPTFNPYLFLKQKMEQNPKLVLYLDDILLTFTRAQTQAKKSRKFVLKNVA